MDALRTAFISAGSTVVAGLLILAFFTLTLAVAWGIFLFSGFLWFAIPFIALAAPVSIFLGAILGVRIHQHFTREPKA